MSDTSHSSHQRSTRSLKIIAGFAILLLGLLPIGFGALLLVDDEVTITGVFGLTLAVSFLAIVPLLAGAIVFGWIVDPRTAEGRVYFVRLVVVVAVAEVIGAVAMGMLAAVNGLQGWLPIAIIACSVFLTVVSILLAESIRRRHVITERPNLSAVGLGPADVRRKVRGVVLTFAIALAVFLVAGIVLVVFVRDEPGSGLDLFLVLLSFPFLAANTACLVVCFPLASRIRPLFGHNLGLQQRVGKVVLKGQQMELRSEDVVVATQYARLMGMYLPFQLAASLLSSASVALVVAGAYVNDDVRKLIPSIYLAFALLLVIFTVGVVPFLVTRIRRVRRYRDGNPDVLPGPAGS